MALAAGQRVVRQLHLRAPSAQAAWQARQLLDDALRCASLPDTGERLLLVRRLALGRLAAGLSTARLAAHIERCVADAGAQWVHADAPGAEAANAVWFASPLQAATSHALRLARGAAVHAWYWPLALPALVGLPAADVPARLAALVQELGAGAAGPARLAAWWLAIAQAGQGAWLQQQLPPASLAMLPVPLRHAAQRLRDAANGAPLVAAVAVAGRLVGPAAGPSPWPVRAATAVHQAPAAATAPAAPQARPAALAAWRPPLSADAALPAPPFTSPMPAAQPGPITADALPTADAWQPGAAATVVVRTPGAAAADGRHLASAPPDGPHTTAPVAVPALPSDSPLHPGLGAFTRLAGLVFVLPVLQRLGIGQHPAADRLAWLVLQAALQRLAPPADDPIHAWVAALAPASAQAASNAAAFAPPGAALATPGTVPEAVADHAPDPVADPVPDSLPADQAVAAAQVVQWLADLRRHLRRHCGIGLASLAWRPGWLAWGPTHIDLSQPLARADLRVRRAGLDINPGWLPWLQRVLAFHYPDHTPPISLPTMPAPATGTRP